MKVGYRWRKRIVVVAALLFFATLFAFTLISHILLLRSLPKVTATPLNGGGMYSALCCTGTVTESNGQYKVAVTVSPEQAEDIHIGDIARVSGDAMQEFCFASVIDIRSDGTNPRQVKVSLQLDDVPSAEGLDFVDVVFYGDYATYDFVVPSSAVYQDASGAYVLLIKSERSILGDRYQVYRVDVEVLAVGENLTAVSGELFTGMNVVTSSEHLIGDGDMVRR